MKTALLLVFGWVDWVGLLQEIFLTVALREKVEQSGPQVFSHFGSGKVFTQLKMAPFAPLLVGWVGLVLGFLQEISLTAALREKLKKKQTPIFCN